MTAQRTLWRWQMVKCSVTGCASRLMPDMTTDFIYDFDLAKIRSATGAAPLNPRIAYTLRRVPKG